VSALPVGWVQTTLGDIAAWGSGGTPTSTEPSYYNGNIPWSVTGDLNDYLVTQCSMGITPLGLNKSSAKLVNPGTILIAMYGASIGKLGIAAIPMATNQAIAFAVPNENRVLPRFLFWYLRSQRSSFIAAGKGAAQPNISQTVLKAWPIYLPSLAEQERVVEAIEVEFSRLDAAELTLRRIDSKLKAFKASAIASSLAGDWETIELGSIITSLKNGIFISRPSANPPGVPILRISAVRPMQLDLTEIRYAQISDQDASDYIITSGDLLFTRYSGNASYVGSCAVVPEGISTIIYPDKLIRVIVDRQKAVPSFVSLFINNGAGRKSINERLKTTAGQIGISGSQLKTVPIALPSIDEQNDILERLSESLSPCGAIIKSVQDSIRRSAQLRQAVLSAAFSGKYSRSNLNYLASEAVSIGARPL